jgi:hypothetical protein
MSINRSTILRVLGRKTATVALVAGSAASAFAVLGDGKGNPKRNISLLSNQTSSASPGRFSLRSGYSFRGNQVISQEKQYINLNAVVTYQKGNTTYIVPLKKKIYVSGGNAGIIINR